MNDRWVKTWKDRLALCDQVELNALIFGKGDPEAKLSFAPEFSQSSYLAMLKSERSIDNYTKIKKFGVMKKTRDSLVDLIQQLHERKEYRLETFYKAVSIADRYLAALAARDEKPPNLLHLGTLCMLMAAKLDQPISPSFNRMISLLPSDQILTNTKQKLIDLETLIVRELDFDLQWVSPLTFLERFIRLFAFDKNEDDKTARIAQKLLHSVTFDSQFLKFKPSQLAASCLLFSIRTNSSKVESKISGLTYWTVSIAEITKITKTDLAPCYERVHHAGAANGFEKMV